MELLLYHYPILGPGLETHMGVFGNEIQDDPHFQYQVGPIHHVKNRRDYTLFTRCCPPAIALDQGHLKVEIRHVAHARSYCIDSHKDECWVPSIHLACFEILGCATASRPKQ